MTSCKIKIPELHIYDEYEIPSLDIDSVVNYLRYIFIYVKEPPTLTTIVYAEGRNGKLVNIGYLVNTYRRNKLLFNNTSLLGPIQSHDIVDIPSREIINY